MHWGCLPVALAAAALSLCTSATQTPLSQATVSKTLVDVLSADPDYVSLLKLLQRTRLIPTLNRLVDSTLFAPTNDAVSRHAERNTLWKSLLEDENFPLADNIQETLRQQLFYHLLNRTLPDPPDYNKVQVHDTLHYPRLGLQPPTRDPPPNPPWMPVPGGSLGGKPQRLRVAADDADIRVGVDAFGRGGASFVKEPVEAANGIVVGIDDMLEVPPDLAQVIQRHPSVSYFNKILGSEGVSKLNSTANLTLFLPVDRAWEQLDPYERLYLESEFAADDLRRILNMHAVVMDHVEWSETFKPGDKLTTLDGTSLEIAAIDHKTKISGAELVQPDIYASNGVLHLVDSLLIPPDALRLTPEKYLLALKCTKFVSLLHSVDLAPLINDTDPEFTILAPTDDILTIMGDSELPERGSEELKRLLQYHFLPGRWTPKKLDDGLLLETELVEEGLAGGRQVLAVEVEPEDPKKKVPKHITFAGAGVVSEPVHVNNSIIYFINRPLTPPTDPLETALPLLDLSSFLAAVLSSSKAETLRRRPHTTLLIPRNEAFRRLGSLVSNHLLSPSAKSDLENVLLHHTLDSVAYAADLTSGGQHSFATVEGSDVAFQRMKNGTMFVGASGGWAGLKAEITPRNLLTKTGVIHEVSDILIPRSVEITIGKLVKAAKGSTMATLVNKAGFDWVLNGTAPPEGSPWSDEYTAVAGWTLLCPPDEAFKEYNLTQLYADEDGLKAIVEQHLIPVPVPQTDLMGEDMETPFNNNRPLVLDDATYSTLRSAGSVYGDIVFQKLEGDGRYVVGIKGARGTQGGRDYAHVMSWGRTTTGGGTGGVVQIDQLLAPYQPKWWVEYGGPTAVGTIGILAICGFFYGVRILWQKDTTEATYEPVGGFGRDDDEE
ncbi:hypothetical protein NMY22_g563 [Coprinellus aureogranulatus]|nr:hypothetical protein NMY22_g563 [Coprinellus aureogranulatus]